jgi:hypothetical protein
VPHPCDSRLRFTKSDELFEAIRHFLRTISEKEWESVFGGWIEPGRWVIAHNGENYQG